MSIVRISQRVGQVGVLSGLLVGLIATTTPGTVALSNGQDVSIVRKLTEGWPAVPQEKTSSDSSQLPDSLVDNPTPAGSLGNFGNPLGGESGSLTGGFGPSEGGFGPSDGSLGSPGLIGGGGFGPSDGIGGGGIGDGGGIGGGNNGGGTVDVSPLPAMAQQAYLKGAMAVADKYPGCHLQWQVIAGIGLVESNHGRFGNRVPDNSGTIAPPIIGPQLNGTNNTKVIRDTDQGRLDGDREFDRAVGPMQFIPETWSRIGQDGNGDGRKDPHNLFDAAQATAWYLCSGRGDLAKPEDLRKALLRYNASSAYVAKVLHAAKQYGAMGPGFDGIPGGGLKPNPGGIGDDGGGLKPSDPKPEEPKPEEPKPDQPKPEQPKPNPGDGMKPNPGDGMKPKPDEGIKPNPGEGDKPKPDEGIKPNPGDGTKPNPGEGDKPKPDEGIKPNPGDGIKPNPGEGDKPKPGEGDKPNPGDGQKPNPGEGDKPKPDQGAGKPDPTIPD